MARGSDLPNLTPVEDASIIPIYKTANNLDYYYTPDQLKNHSKNYIITSGAGIPSGTPDFVGQIYIDTTNDVTYIAIDSSSAAGWRKSISQDVDGNYEVDGKLYFKATKTITPPTGTTFTMDANDGNSQFVDLENVTGDVTATFSNFAIGTYILIVEHDSTARTLTFPSAYLVGVTGTGTTAFSLAAGGTMKTLFTIYYDGTNYYITETMFHA